MLDFLAVVAGIITPTIILSGEGSMNLNLDQETRQFMVSVSLIVRCRLFHLQEILKLTCRFLD